MTLPILSQTSSYAEEALQALDADFLEFLSLYDSADEELVDLVIDEETDSSGQGKNRASNKIEEVN